MKRRIVVLGAGESGMGAGILAKKNNLDVFISDSGIINEKHKIIFNKNGIHWEEKKHTEENILTADEVIKSPGISDKADIIKKIKSKGIPVISEIEFAGRYSNATMICITGSNGKTTTTLLTYHILKRAGFNVGLAGNVGKSLALQVAEKDYDYYVIELSSFQLDGMYNFKINLGILLNITPDHLDRYEYKMQNYIDSKFRITQNMKPEDFLVYCYDDAIIKNELKKKDIKATLLPFSIKQELERGAYVINDKLIINLNTKPFTMSIFDLALQGKHNLYNSMAAGIASKIFEIRKDTIRESLSDFQNIEHRLEYVATVHGIDFINDSKATNINSVWFALESMNKPVIWIVGGIDKGNDYSILKELVKEKVKGIICLGNDNTKIQASFKKVIPTIIETKSASEAVQAAYRIGKKGDVVLLSPACASFDLFANYEDRGRQFKNAVKAL